MANNHYEAELKEKVLRLYLEEGRTKKSLTEEYNLGQENITYWLQQHRKECEINPTLQNESEQMHEIRRFKKELTESKKENDFLK